VRRPTVFRFKVDVWHEDVELHCPVPVQGVCVWPIWEATEDVRNCHWSRTHAAIPSQGRNLRIQALSVCRAANGLLCSRWPCKGSTVPIVGLLNIDHFQKPFDGNCPGATPCVWGRELLK
jgi:hypothetical protein